MYAQFPVKRILGNLVDSLGVIVRYTLETLLASAIKTQKLHFHRTKCIRELEYIRRMRRNRAVTGRLIRGIGGALGVKRTP